MKEDLIFVNYISVAMALAMNLRFVKSDYMLCKGFTTLFTTKKQDQYRKRNKTTSLHFVCI